jgi:glycosyltransferase involved in cell wall biosynthesis
MYSQSPLTSVASLKIVQVIHGYPPRYSAGSEVYTQTLCHALSRAGHQVFVFTREENPFEREYALRQETDELDSRIRLDVINLPTSKDRYRHEEVDRAFGRLLDRVRPDIVHVGHLNHLSTSLVFEASNRGIPLFFTAHDFWPVCPRGQFVRMDQTDGEPWPLCYTQDDAQCARRCYHRYFGGAPEDAGTDLEYWAGWVRRRMEHMRKVMSRFDVVIAPSRQLMEICRRRLGLSSDRLLYLDYGFDLERLGGRCRRKEPDGSFVFGYIGTHIPSKGIDRLIRAFAGLRGAARLRIWGHPQEPATGALKRLADGLGKEVSSRIEWMEGYDNHDIVRDVFDRVDAIVVPSIWLENSPLVIHEALQARVAVVTADAGGMAEFVRDGENGLLFRHRDEADLRRQMQRLVDEPGLAARLARRGYLQSKTGDVPGVQEHTEEILALYRKAIESSKSAGIPVGEDRS